MNIDFLQTPIGKLEIKASETGVHSILFVDSQPEKVSPSNLTDEACRQLNEYFNGKRRTFDLPLAAKGTDFQQRVWQALSTIPFGDTVSYAYIANAIGKPAAARAVGAANGKNPLSIVVPCHRIIGANGNLTGYAGGLERKAYLLNLEQA
ncbi:methylated-DNA--[protein]-cysteine S-methyltransferase [Neptunicella marina]|uniref:Methylated-DNA--protein-cysteine methyltransferase n=1 Tax=Neptunicella marina TaxID=2125989 RepID=A0A8J6IVF6_9ALTE|nr:methylated-DNA--[protein]-cysteine S-methyltransferase [Neptunicella marina]MBC3766560.1 methylated-DNA--[protein]-cysteine S-methyltransferase [Neptunicella marina]